MQHENSKKKSKIVHKKVKNLNFITQKKTHTYIYNALYFYKPTEKTHFLSLSVSLSIPLSTCCTTYKNIIPLATTFSSSFFTFSFII